METRLPLGNRFRSIEQLPLTDDVE